MFYKYFCRRIIRENNVPSGSWKKDLLEKKAVIGIMKFISGRKNVMKIRGGLHSSSSALLKERSSHRLMKNLELNETSELLSITILSNSGVSMW